MVRDGKEWVYVEVMQVVLGSGANICSTRQALTPRAVIAALMLSRAAGCESR